MRLNARNRLLNYFVRQLAPVAAGPAQPTWPRCGGDMMPCAEILPASAMMAAAVALTEDLMVCSCSDPLQTQQPHLHTLGE